MSTGVKPLVGSRAQLSSWADVAELTIDAGTLTIDASTSAAFLVQLDADITTLTLPNTSGKSAVFVLAMTQDDVGARVVSWPASAVTPAGTTVPAISATIGSTTLVRITCFGELPPVVELLGTFAGAEEVPSPWPLLLDENSTFANEGVSIAGWTVNATTMSIAGDYIRATNDSSAPGHSSQHAITMPDANRDFVIYAKVRAAGGTATSVLWLLNGSKEISIWFGSSAANSANTDGAISICGTTGTATRNVASLGGGYDYTTTPIELALQFSEKFQTLTCWFREPDGRWKYKGRTACSWFSAATIDLAFTAASPAGAWIEYDYLAICKPNIMLLSDSIGEGKTLYSPNTGLALTNDESTWMRHAALYPTLRNNLIVNVGVGGNTSTQMLSRLAADVTNHSPRLVLLHASSNDYVIGITQGTRTTNIQSIVTDCVAAGAAVVLLNAMYGTVSDSNNPGQRDYGLTWWTTSMPTITDLAFSIDIMVPVLDGGFMDATKTQADNIHPNIAGHTAIGDYIATYVLP